MPSVSSASINIQLAGYSAERVFFGRVGRAGGNFAAGRIGAPGRGRSIFAGLPAAGDQAGGAASSPASITGNQALSDGRLRAVATAASQRGAGSAELRRFRTCLLLIANLWTSATARAQRVAGEPSRRAIGRGGATPSTARAASYIPSRTPCRDLRKSAPKPVPSPDRERASARPGPGFRFGRDAETPNCEPGSGVREYPTRAKSARESADFQALATDAGRNRAAMGCVANGHAVLDLRGNGQTITGRG